MKVRKRVLETKDILYHWCKQTRHDLLSNIRSLETNGVGYRIVKRLSLIHI